MSTIRFSLMMNPSLAVPFKKTVSLAKAQGLQPPLNEGERTFSLHSFDQSVLDDMIDVHSDQVWRDDNGCF